jgi:hypothetical protein
MTAVRLNHQDIRDFLARAGSTPQTDRSYLGTMTHVAHCLGLGDGALRRRVRTDRPATEPGIPFEFATWQKLSAVFQRHDMTLMKNTKRLELVAETFGWDRTDAFMHLLKTDFPGSNRSLARDHEDFPDPTIFNIGLSNAEEWIRQFSAHESGLFIIAGPTGCGKTLTANLTVQHLRALDGSWSFLVREQIVGGASWGPHVGVRDMRRMMLGYSHDLLLIDELRDAAETQIALEAAERTRVLITSPASAPLLALALLQEAARVDSASPVRAVLAQTLVRSAQGKGRIAISDLRTFESPDDVRAFVATSPSDPMGGLRQDAIRRIRQKDTTVEHVESRLGYGFLDAQGATHDDIHSSSASSPRMDDQRP